MKRTQKQKFHLFSSGPCMAFLLSLISAFSFAQNDISIRYGTEFDPKGTINDFVGQVDDIIYMTSFKRDLYITGIDATSLTQQFEEKIEMPEYNNHKVALEGVYVIGKSLIMTATLYDRTEDKNYLFAQKISSKGKLQGGLEKLAVISADSESRAGSFSLYATGNRLCVFRNTAFEKYDKEKFGVKVLDADLEIVWETDLELPYVDRYFVIGDCELDERDNIYMLCTFDDFRATVESEGRRKAKEEKRERGGNRNSYSLIAYDPKAKKVNELALDLGTGLRIIDIGYNIGVKGDINVSGVYGNNGSDGTAVGAFFSKIDQSSKKVLSVSTRPFEKEFIASMIGDRSAGKGEGIGNFVIRNFVNRDDGGLVVCGEQYYTYDVCTTDPRTGYMRCSTHYVYKDIMVLNIDAKGNIEWISTIPKIQHTVNDDGFYSSFGMIVGKGNLYFFFNDNPKNYNPKKKPRKIYPMAKASKSVTTIARVDASGNLQTEPSVKLKQAKMLLRPKVYNYVGEGDAEKLIMLAKGRKLEKAVEVKISGS